MNFVFRESQYFTRRTLRDQTLSALLYTQTKQKQILKNALRFQRQQQGTSDHVQ